MLWIILVSLEAIHPHEQYIKHINKHKHQCRFQHNRSTTDQNFCIHQILDKKWEYNEIVYQLFVEFEKVYDSARREILYNILIEFGVPMKLIRLIKMCLNETYNKVRIGNFLIQNDLK
jgi:hypothetical protein